MTYTAERTVVTLNIGAFCAKETILGCPHCDEMVRSEELQSLVPYRCKFGFDVLVSVGKALFIRFRGVNEIIQDVAAKNITVSDREISFLGKKFVIYLALAHRESSEHLQNYLNRRGGFILHCDGTVEGNSPHLFTGLDELSEIVLDNVKLPSEKADLLIPFFQRIKQQFGKPIALVHDMGKGILSAVEVVFPGVPDYICHSHFLTDIGKDLMKDSYSKILNRLKTHRIRPKLREKIKAFMKSIDDNGTVINELKRGIDEGSFTASYYQQIPAASACALVNWALDESHLDGYGFPFDRKHYDFYERLKDINNTINQIMDIYLRGEIKDNKPFYKLRSLLRDVIDDKLLQKTALEMKEEIEVFEKLRKALHVAPPNGKKGLNDDGGEIDMRTIEEKVKSFREWITTEERFLGREKYKKMVKQLDKYWEKLFREPIWVDTPDGRVAIQPQRTNNIMEQFFRHTKRGYRKRTGTSNLSKTLKAMLADTPLVKNLENDEYLKIILNGCNSLEERFAQIDAKLVVKELRKAKKELEKLPLDMRKMVMKPDLPKKMATLFAKLAS